MKKNRAFTIIELLAVIIILGVLLVIAVPNVVKNIFSSKTSSYAFDVDAYAKSAINSALNKDYGILPDDDELMIIPFEKIILEKSNGLESPYGPYDLDRSYIVIVPDKNGAYQAYAYAYDEIGYGVINVHYKEIAKSSIKTYAVSEYTTYSEMSASLKGLTYGGASGVPGMYDTCYNLEETPKSILICSK